MQIFLLLCPGRGCCRRLLRSGLPGMQDCSLRFQAPSNSMVEQSHGWNGAPLTAEFHECPVPRDGPKLWSCSFYNAYALNSLFYCFLKLITNKDMFRNIEYEQRTISHRCLPGLLVVPFVPSQFPHRWRSATSLGSTLRLEGIAKSQAIAEKKESANLN